MSTINITGISDSRSSYIFGKIINEELKGNKGQYLIVTANSNRARALAADLSLFVDKNIYLMESEDETLTFYDAKNRESMYQRMKVLERVINEPGCIVVAPVFSAIKKLMPKNVFQENSVVFNIGDEIDTREIGEKLVKIGYERVPMIYQTGQFSLRGSILDIFPPYESEPCRIELFDIEVDSIRTFDIDTQRSIRKLKKARIFPSVPVVLDDLSYNRGRSLIDERYSHIPERRDELIHGIETGENVQQLEYYIEYFYQYPAQIMDYMTQPTVFVDDPGRISEVIKTRDFEYEGDFKEMLTRGRVCKDDYNNFAGSKELDRLYSVSNIYFGNPFSDVFGASKGGKANVRHVNSKEGMSYNGKMDIFEKDVRGLLKDGYEVTVVSSNDDRTENIKEFINREDLTGKIKVVTGALSRGMDFPDLKVAYITDRDIFGSNKIKRRRKTKMKNAAPIKSFTDIKPGDYVVHENYGVGQYVGIKQIEKNGLKKDYLYIKYAGEDALYVSVENMDFIQKYMGSDAIVPKINKLSGTEWARTKSKVREAVMDMAKELVDVSAKRKAEPGHAFEPDTVWQKEFEDDFPFEETADQLRCVEEIKRDMESPVAMDRLLCGDVGFGKTEVAARGIFKCAIEGKQAAVLVPTTILANQHYNTLKERFSKFPFKIEMLSRFRTPAQQKKIIQDLKDGQVDILIGTHRLLSEDIEFKDLGMLVIDEEQRFGVTHKEKIKKLRKNVDVLTLSATPIPRTLHMSLVGIRDMSVIEEPPQERLPVQTYVMEEDDFVMREAIEREIGRGGQVFVVFNKVRGIQRLAQKIQKLVPSCKVIVGHGQMNEHELEDIMMAFINGEADVLIATTIIETGIDIPNVNTEIIIDADKYGLSQLYQLRGRVGRSTKLAYAYLMHKKGKALNEVAEKRLRAIREFTEFGAGFKIAMRDLEIRGAGNLLGTQQHGHMVSVGYELYCKLVDEAVMALKGETVKKKEEIHININMPAFIPESYVYDEVVKFNVYKQMADIKSAEDMDDLLVELEDRFGVPPTEVINLARVSYIKAMAEEIGMVTINEKDKTVQFKYAGNKQRPVEFYKRPKINLLEDIADFLEEVLDNKERDEEN